MTTKKRGAGRPKAREGAKIVDAILRATLKRLATQGFDKLSIAQVARDVGVTPSSVYRRYPTKEKLLVAAVRSLPRGSAWDVAPTGDTRADLLRILKAKAARATHKKSRLVTRSLIAVDDAELRPMMRRFHDASLVQLTALLDSAAQKGEVDGSANLPLALELLNAFILYRTHWLKAPLDDASLEGVVDHLLAGLRKRPRARRSIRAG